MATTIGTGWIILRRWQAGRGRGAYLRQKPITRTIEGPNFYGGWAPTNETDLAIQFIEKHMDARTDDPFAVFVSWRPPHWPYKQYPDEYNIYDPADMDVPGNVPNEMKAWAHEELADYYGCCTGLDAEMGPIIGSAGSLRSRGQYNCLLYIRSWRSPFKPWVWQTQQSLVGRVHAGFKGNTL